MAKRENGGVMENLRSASRFYGILASDTNSQACPVQSGRGDSRALGWRTSAAYIEMMFRLSEIPGPARWLAATALIVLAFLAFLVGARADQRDPRLDTLFAELQRTTSESAADSLVAEIWQRWTAFENDARATNMMAVGIRQMNLGQFDNAERIFSDLAQTHPDHAEVWNKRATVRFMRGNDSGSRRDIARVINLEPRHFGALSGLGMINMRAGDLPAALQAFEAAVRVNPHMDQAEAMIADLRQRLRGRAL